MESEPWQDFPADRSNRNVAKNPPKGARNKREWKNDRLPAAPA
jgi:hypothetical protein